MARREKKKQEVSLFPFLDILACVIGNLILIITAVVLEQVDTKPMAEVVDREAKLGQKAGTVLLHLGKCIDVSVTVAVFRY